MPTYPYKDPGVTGGGRYGIYGGTCPPLHTPSVSQGHWSAGQVQAPEKTRNISQGNEAKRERTIKRTRGVFRTNVSPVFRSQGTPGGSGQKIEYVYSDPSVQAYLHLEDDGPQGTAKEQRVGWAQTHEEIVRANRVNANRMHSALIRPAAPAQANWKRAYVVGQRNVSPQGPYYRGPQQSIIQRIGAATGLNKGG